MSGALVVVKQQFPVFHEHKPAVPAPFTDRRVTVSVTPHDMDSEADRSGFFMIESNMGVYGRDARIISTATPGLIIDTYI